MTGPTNPQAADPKARGGQYVTSPGFASPGHSTPSHSRTAPDSTIVYSPKGWKWEEAGDDYSLAVSKVAGAAIESSVRRMRTTFGQVFYIKGTAESRPPFNGEAVGDTCRIQDAITLDIVAEWRWTGVAWERMQVSNQQISNLDVGKLTAGSASINELAARKIASDVGRFLELTTEQLTVTGNASFVDLTARHIWTRIVTAQQGEFEQIKAGMIAANAISADNIQAGALNGQVITGATIQTSAASNRGLKIHDNGMQVYASDGWKALDINAWSGEIEINGRIGRRDTWSEVYFNDIVARDTKTDVSNGLKHGCGLSFNSLEDDWWPATISLNKNSTGTPTLRLQGAISKAQSYYSPYLSISQDAIAMYMPQGDSSFTFTSGGMSMGTGKMYMWMNDQGFSLGKKGDNSGRLYVGTNSYRIRPLGWSAGGLWGQDNGVGMDYAAGKQIWVGPNGTSMVGGKTFAMLVPVESAKRGGKYLTHRCTESPYDGLEYWENFTLDASGHAAWELPEYVPWIASERSPWIALASNGATAHLVRGGYGPGGASWSVEISGQPGTTVSVLVKGARRLDSEVDDDGEPILEDRADDDLWIEKPNMSHGFFGATPPPGRPESTAGGMIDGIGISREEDNIHD